MKALYKVMETSTPAPEDVNTLMVLTRDLTKDLPGGGSGLPVFAGFNVDDMGLLPEGDVIVYFEGVPHINTQFGKFNPIIRGGRGWILPIGHNGLPFLTGSYYGHKNS